PSAVRSRGAGRPPARATARRPHRLSARPAPTSTVPNHCTGKALTITPDKPTSPYAHPVTDRPHDRPETSHPDHRHAPEHRDDGRVYVPWSRIELPEGPSGWDSPDVADHPDRPDPRDIHLSDDRRAHILDGDPGTLYGGHRFGTGNPGKTEFPEHWSDARTAARILDVARNPDEPPEQQPNRRWVCRGTRDEVAIRVIVWPEGRIWTAWPMPDSPGVRRNPPAQETP
ncbi:MAG: EndoU domain-containing protein, partial [Stackebrandtia sp.]